MDSQVASEPMDIIISKDDFYRYGWEISRTDQIAFGKEVEMLVKLLMRNIVGVNLALRGQINTSILHFQEKYDYTEDVWAYETIKKDFYRNGNKERIDFKDDIFEKLERIVLENLSDFGTLSHNALKYYEHHKESIQ